MKVASKDTRPGKRVMFKTGCQLKGRVTNTMDLGMTTLIENGSIASNAVIEMNRAISKYRDSQAKYKPSCYRKLVFHSMEGNDNVEIPCNQLEDTVPLESAMFFLYTTTGLCGRIRERKENAGRDLRWYIHTESTIAMETEETLSCIETLPLDILLKLLTEYVPLRDALSVCQTSSVLMAVRKTPLFWSRRLLLDHRCTFTFRDGTERSYITVEDTYKTLTYFDL